MNRFRVHYEPGSDEQFRKRPLTISRKEGMKIQGKLPNTPELWQQPDLQFISELV